MDFFLSLTLDALRQFVARFAPEAIAERTPSTTGDEATEDGCSQLNDGQDREGAAFRGKSQGGILGIKRHSIVRSADPRTFS